jgi:acetyltransferase
MTPINIRHRPLASVVEPCIRAATAADGAELAAFLTRLSPDSAYLRFLTGLAGPPSSRLLSALLPERPAGGALLGFLGQELVGHGLWVRLADPAHAEIALVVADHHQRRGIGMALAQAVVDDLAAHGVTDIEVFSSAGNTAVARMIARRAPDARRELDGATATYTFRARSERTLLPRTA